jgi:hypothetical protein
MLRDALQRFLWQDRRMSMDIQTILRDLFNLKNNEICAVLSQEVKTIVGDKWLNCFNNNFYDLLNFFTALEYIDLSNSVIKTIEISGNTCPKLKKLTLYNTQNLESVKLSGSLNALEYIDLWDSGIKKLKVSGTYSKLKKTHPV